MATATCSASAGIATAALPADLKAVYQVKLQGNDPKTLFYTDRRTYNRHIYHQDSLDTPTHYTLFYQGNSGLIEFIDTPNADVTATVFYYRRIAIATATASALDFPDDYVDYLLAWAKWHYLNDKGEQSERARNWLQYAEMGMVKMKEADSDRPDEDLAFKPSYDMGGFAEPPRSLAELRAWYGRY